MCNFILYKLFFAYIFFSQLEHVYANENKSYSIEKKNKNNDLDFIIKKIELNKDEELLLIDKHSKKK